MIVNEGIEIEFERLVKNNANINRKNEDGNSALSLAATNGKKYILSLNIYFSE